MQYTPSRNWGTVEWYHTHPRFRKRHRHLKQRTWKTRRLGDDLVSLAKLAEAGTPVGEISSPAAQKKPPAPQLKARSLCHQWWQLTGPAGTCVRETQQRQVLMSSRAFNRNAYTRGKAWHARILLSSRRAVLSDIFQTCPSTCKSHG